MYSIYKITHKDSGKCYIGQTMDFERRRKEHCRPSSRCKKISRAIQKYGKDAFEWEVILLCNEEMVDYYEIELIKAYDTIKNGYNLEYGGNKNKTPSEETKQKMSDIHRDIERPYHAEWMIENCAWGEEHPNSKLSNTQRQEIISLYNMGYYTQKQIGEMYNVSQTCVKNIIKRNKKWQT